MEALSEYRSEIYGISIFWVMLFHMKESHYFPTIKGSSLYHAWMGFVGMGNMGVDIFLFLSGICLYFSFTKNPDFYAFIKKRIARIAYPVCFTSMLLWLQYLIMHRISIWGFVNRVFLLQYWIDSDRQVWYVSLLLILYFVYPYIYRFFFEKNNMSIVHRVIDVKQVDGEYRYYTKGDANGQADEGYITNNEIFAN